MIYECFMQVFKDYAEQGDAWLSSKEAFLNNEDLGVSILRLKQNHVFIKMIQTHRTNIMSRYIVKFKSDASLLIDLY